MVMQNKNEFGAYQAEYEETIRNIDAAFANDEFMASLSPRFSNAGEPIDFAQQAARFNVLCEELNTNYNTLMRIK